MRKTIKQKIKNTLTGMKVGEEIKKEDITISIWGDDNYFVRRSFDAHICIIKKELPDMEFKTNEYEKVKRMK